MGRMLYIVQARAMCGLQNRIEKGLSAEIKAHLVLIRQKSRKSAVLHGAVTYQVPLPTGFKTVPTLGFLLKDKGMVWFGFSI